VGSGTGFGYGLTLFWVSVGLTIGYWIIAALARLSAAWNRGRGVGLRWAGTVLASAVSGERLAASPALLRFGESFWLNSAGLALNFRRSHTFVQGYYISYTVVCLFSYDRCGMAEICVYAHGTY
jgi:hypothetical protein